MTQQGRVNTAHLNQLNVAADALATNFRLNIDKLLGVKPKVKEVKKKADTMTNLYTEANTVLTELNADAEDLKVFIKKAKGFPDINTDLKNAVDKLNADLIELGLREPPNNAAVFVDLNQLRSTMVYVGQTVTLDATATDADGDTLIYRYERKDGEVTPAMPVGVDMNAAQLVFTPTEAGTYTFNAIVSDGTDETIKADIVVTAQALTEISVPATATVDEDGVNATITVTSTAPPLNDVVLNVTYGGTATGNADPTQGDYDNDATQSVTLSMGTTSVDIVVPITDDAVDDDAETIEVTVAPSVPLTTGMVMGNATCVVTIIDNDPAPQPVQQPAQPVAPSAKLTTIEVVGADIAPAFSNAQNDYTSTVEHDDEAVIINVEAADSNAAVQIIDSGSTVLGTSTPLEVNLSTGTNEVTIVVTNGSAKEVYRLTITRPAAPASQ